MQTINLDIYKKTIIPVLYAKQGDVGRKFKVIITDGTDGYAIPAGVNLSVWYSGASGEGNYSEIGGNSAFAIEGNTVTIEMIAQMLNNAGCGTLCLIMAKADGTQIGTWNVPYMVEKVPGMGSKPAQQHFNLLYEAQKNAKAAAARAEDAANRAEEVMTDTDASLSVEGKAADAKATGDALVLVKGKKEGSAHNKSASAEADHSIAYGNGATALTSDSVALGNNATAGVKGFYATCIDYGARKIWLTTKIEKAKRPYLANTKPDDIHSYMDWDTSFKLSDYFSVGDIIAIQAKGYYHWLPNYNLDDEAQRFKITRVSNSDNYIEVAGWFAGTKSEDPNAESYLRIIGSDKWVANENGAYSDVTFHVSIPTKPNAGLVTLDQGSAFASGENAIAASGWATSIGLDTMAYGLYSYAEGRGTKAGYAGHAEGYETSATGFQSHSEGRETEASGHNSHAQGWKTKATGESSHSEGSETESIGNASHAEGCATTASGGISHTEGCGTKSPGDFSHAEGLNTIASGKASHAEGASNQALGENSHAEGSQNKAIGKNSHAEGVVTEARGSTTHTEGMGTIATANFSHVQGRYNIEDTAGKYAHIVGNGTISGSTVTRSNAHTIDWDGNAWFAGSVEADAIILKSPNGTRFRITVSDSGVLETARITA